MYPRQPVFTRTRARTRFCVTCMRRMRRRSSLRWSCLFMPASHLKLVACIQETSFRVTAAGINMQVPKNVSNRMTLHRELWILSLEDGLISPLVSQFAQTFFWKKITNSIWHKKKIQRPGAVFYTLAKIVEFVVVKGTLSPLIFTSQQGCSWFSRERSKSLSTGLSYLANWL